MADLTKVRVQLINPETGEMIENVDVKTSDGAVYLPDGTTLRDYLNSIGSKLTKDELALKEHTSMTHVDEAKVSRLLTDISYTENDGVFKFIRHDGTEVSINTALEKIAINFTLEEDANTGGKFLVLTLEDGSTMKVNVTELVDVYTGSNGEQIIVSIGSDGIVKASIKEGSIKLADLNKEIQDAIKNSYTLPIATDTTLGGVKGGGNVDIKPDGTMQATNIRYGHDIATSSIANIFFKIDNPANVHLEWSNNLSKGNNGIVNYTRKGTITSFEVSSTIKTVEGDASPNPSDSEVKYTWYKKSIGVDSYFVKISSATGSTYTPDTTTDGTTIYYVVSTIIGTTTDGTDIVCDTIKSDEVVVIVSTPEVNVVTYNGFSPVKAEYTVDDTATPIGVTVNEADFKTVTYQWKYNNHGDATIETINGATASTYTPPTDTVSDREYFVEITGTTDDNHVVTTTSKKLWVSVTTSTPLIKVQFLTVDGNQDSVTSYTVGDTATPIGVTVNEADFETVTYQWYKSVNGEESTPIEGATTTTLVPETNVAVTSLKYHINVLPTMADGRTNSTNSSIWEFTITE